MKLYGYKEIIGWYNGNYNVEDETVTRYCESGCGHTQTNTHEHTMYGGILCVVLDSERSCVYHSWWMPRTGVVAYVSMSKTPWENVTPRNVYFLFVFSQYFVAVCFLKIGASRRTTGVRSVDYAYIRLSSSWSTYLWLYYTTLCPRNACRNYLFRCKADEYVFLWHVGRIKDKKCS